MNSVPFQRNGEPMGFFFEDERGTDHFTKILPKCALYYKHHRLLKQEYKLVFFGVVWNCRLASWVPKIAAAIRTLPKEAWSFFLINAEKDIDPFRPDSILDKMYLSPIDNQYHGVDSLFPKEE